MPCSVRRQPTKVRISVVGRIGLMGAGIIAVRVDQAEGDVARLLERFKVG
jgi:uncharacterized membrane protein YhiD involved in acid resistance